MAKMRGLESLSGVFGVLWCRLAVVAVLKLPLGLLMPFAMAAVICHVRTELVIGDLMMACGGIRR